jgi:hypothetical protein
MVLYCQAWAKMVWAERMLSRAMKDAEERRAAAEAAGEEYTGGTASWSAPPTAT